MPWTVSKRFRFSAAHRLTTVGADDPCSRVHGHNYEAVVTLSGDRLDAHGMVTNFHDLRPFKAWLDEHLDHRLLNDVFPGELMTAESLARRLCFVAIELFPGDTVQSVRLYETPDSWTEYAP